MDFDTFTTNGPSDTSETGGGACQDILTTTTVNTLPFLLLDLFFKHIQLNLQNTGQSIPEICGENSGQHSNEIPF